MTAAIANSSCLVIYGIADLASAQVTITVGTPPALGAAAIASQPVVVEQDVQGLAPSTALAEDADLTGPVRMTRRQPLGLFLMLPTVLRHSLARTAVVEQRTEFFQ
jgi:hypothetical protein